MKKLKLDIEQLAVESFASGAVRNGPGTVHGHGGDTGPQGGTTVIPHYCYPNSNIMDCEWQLSERSCEVCPVGM